MAVSLNVGHLADGEVEGRWGHRDEAGRVPRDTCTIPTLHRLF